MIVLPELAPGAAPDHLTTAGRTRWREECPGTQVTLVNAMGGTFARDANGELRAYAALMGQPEQIAVVDVRGQRTVGMVDVPGAEGAYDILAASPGVLYLGSHPNGNFYRFLPAEGRVENLGVPAEGVTFIWEVAEGPGGKVYGACYPKAKVFEFDPATSAVRDLGTMAEGEDYARCIAYDPGGGKLYAGIGSHAGLIELDPVTGAKRDILPAAYKSEQFVYYVAVSGGRLFAKLSSSPKTLVFNLATGEIEATIPAMNSNTVSDPAPGDGAIYFLADGKLTRYDPSTRGCAATGLKANAGGRGFAWDRAEGDTTAVLYVLLSNGKLMRHDPATGRGSVLDPKIPGQPINLQNIAVGPNGLVYSSGYVVGNLGVYDPRTGSHEQFTGVKQAEGITAYGSRLYFGTYPGAVISVLDTAKPRGRDNPREVFRLHDQGQDRPFAMLGVEREKKVFVGTVPGYGLLGGALSIYDPETSSLVVHRDVVPGHSVVSLAYADGILFGGTSVSGGLGIEPREHEARLFLWDVARGEKVFEIVPEPGQRGVTGLRIGPDGNLWGWAEGVLFVFDPKRREIVHRAEVFPAEDKSGHYWRGAFMTEAVDGGFYCLQRGKLFRLDAITRGIEIIAEGKGMELLSRGNDGSLYFAKNDKLYRLVPVGER
jgi:outer membrane protein assembly factor BamB